MKHKKRSTKANGWHVFGASTLTVLGVAVITNFGSYIFTDLAGVPYAISATIMSVVSTICIFTALLTGAIISRTKVKMGANRFWCVVSCLLAGLGGCMMFFKSDNLTLTTIIVGLGYFIVQFILSFNATSMLGIQMSLGGSDSDARSLMGSMSWGGMNFGYILLGLIMVPMTIGLAFRGESQGYFLTHVIFAVLALGGSLWLIAVAPREEASEEVVEENVNLLEMVKGVLGNRPGLMMVLSCALRYTGTMLLVIMVAYQSEYVLEDMNAMSYYLTLTGIMAVLGAMVAPKITQMMGGRKRAAYLGALSSALVLAVLGFAGKSLVGFSACTALAYLTMAVLDSNDPVMFADAGEYYLNKTGKDTRTYMISMYTVSSGIGMTLATALLGFVLSLVDYNPGMVLDAAGKSTMTMATGLVPAVCYLLLPVFYLIHGVSDKEMERCIEENSEKYGALQ